MKIHSPMATGNGAYILHKTLETHIPGYRVQPYNPWWTLFPPVLSRFRDPTAHLIHTAPDYAPWFRKGNARLVITFHNYMLDPFMRRFSSLAQNLHYRTDLRWFTRQAVTQADAVTSVSHFTANLAAADLGYLDPIQVIPNGVDHHRFTPGPPRPTNRCAVLFSGNLTRRKGAQWLPAIAARLAANIQILYTQGLRTRKALPPHLRLQAIGPLAYPDMPKLYSSVDLLLMPTVREGMSLAVLEAMASGLPVIASNVASMPELVDEGQGGHLCPLGDVQTFADRINQLAADPDQRRRMGEYNRAKIESTYTLEQMVAAYRQLFEELN